MGARLLGKFAYIKNMEHIINQLEYAGNKIAHQDVVFENGRVKEQDGCTKLKISDEEIKSVSYIKFFYKDGGHKKLDYDDYTKLVSDKEEKITISKIEALNGDVYSVLKSTIDTLKLQLKIKDVQLAEKDKQISELTSTIKSQAESINADRHNQLAETLIDGGKKKIENKTINKNHYSEKKTLKQIKKRKFDFSLFKKR